MTQSLASGKGLSLRRLFYLQPHSSASLPHSPPLLHFLLLSPINSMHLRLTCLYPQSAQSSQLRLKPCWVTTTPEAERPPNTKHWLFSLASPCPSQGRGLQAASGSGFCSCVSASSLDQLAPSHRLPKETGGNLKAKV